MKNTNYRKESLCQWDLKDNKINQKNSSKELKTMSNQIYRRKKKRETKKLMDDVR